MFLVISAILVSLYVTVGAALVNVVDDHYDHPLQSASPLTGAAIFLGLSVIWPVVVVFIVYIFTLRQVYLAAELVSQAVVAWLLEA